MEASLRGLQEFGFHASVDGSGGEKRATSFQDGQVRPSVQERDSSRAGGHWNCDLLSTGGVDVGRGDDLPQC